jgi:hypothetical protein
LKRLLPALVAFVIALAALVPPALSLPQHGDEKMYVWKAGYYGGLLTRLDFRTTATDCETDPAWSLGCFWSFEQPLGSHLLYGAAMALTQSAPPLLGYSWTNPAFQGPETEISASTLLVVREAGVLFAALGLAMIALRWRWPAVAAVVIFLAIPHVPADLSRAWAEGPLLLGFGFCALAFGSRWLPVACGVAAAFKLTALGLWPLLFWPRAQGGLRTVRGPLLALVTFAAVNPHSWTAGPFYLGRLLGYRIHQHAAQTNVPESLIDAFFLPTRYLWPFELAVLLVLCVAASRFWFGAHGVDPRAMMGTWRKRWTIS